VPDSPESSTERLLTFETALAELEAIVERLEKGEMPLDVALADFERGIALVRECNRTLDAMELRVEQLLVTEDGEIAVTPFDPDASEGVERE
jgi:exodeoxyribonuclease VII small subunit